MYRGPLLLAALRLVSLVSLFPIHLALAQRVSDPPDVVISEIMYHVKASEFKEDFDAEFIELHNRSSNPVDLTGWQFTSGIRFTFPEVTLAAGGYLVIAPNVEAFQERHPDVAQVLGPYRGRLSNSGEEITLEDADEEEIDSVTYADSGFWAARVSEKLKGHDDWVWEAPHDGLGFSLELINPGLTNDYGHNWLPSKVSGGSPGMANGVKAENVAPLVMALNHTPAIPSSSDEVTITASATDESLNDLKVNLFYRPDGAKTFIGVEMTRDQSGAWIGNLPRLADQTIVQFYVEAVDSQGAKRDYPSLTRTNSGALSQRQAVHLFQVDDHFDAKAVKQPGAKPVYRLITTKTEIEMLRNLAKMSGRSSVYDNHLHCTFISVDGVDTKVRYNVSARIRGHGSRSAFPPGLRVSFPSDHPWKGVTDINLNTQYTHSQALGAAIHRLAGFAAATSTPIHMRINGEDWAKSGSPQYGCYVHNEVFNGDYIDNHFPGESGNLYRLVGNANLYDMGSNLSNYRRMYNKRNHGSEDDYSDIIRLVKTLDQRNPPDDYYKQVDQVIDIEQWARFIAMDALLCNIEGGMSSGRGDDVCIFARPDGRFQLVPYDLDSIVGLGDESANINKSVFDYGNMRGLRSLFRDPQFRKLYIEKFHELTSTVYQPEILNQVVDDLLGGWIPDTEITKIKTFIPRRIEAVMNQIKSSTMIGSTLDQAGGIHRATSDAFALYGRFDMGSIHSVSVGGVEPKTFSKTGVWILSPDRVKELIHPGINQVPIIMRDQEGNVIQQETMRVWLDQGDIQNVEGPLASDQTIVWKAIEGPYSLNGAVEIPETTTLRIEGGTTVYANEDAQLIVRGQLQIQGDARQKVTFAANPQSDGNGSWNGIAVEGAQANVALTHVDLLDLGGGVRITGGQANFNKVQFIFEGDQALVAEGGAKIHIDDCEFNQTVSGNSALVAAQSSSLEINGSVFRRLRESGPAIDGENNAKVVLFNNRFEEGANPSIRVRGKAFIDANDFLTSGSGSPVIAGSAAVVTRCRYFPGATLVNDAALKEGNVVLDGPVTHREVTVAEAQILRSPPSRIPGPTVSFEIGGPGIDEYRFRLDEGEWSPPQSGDVTIQDLAPGKHRLSVIGRNRVGQWQPVEEPTVSEVFEVDPELISLRINELLAINRSTSTPVGDEVDYIEIHNYGASVIDLGGFALSDDRDDLSKYRFPRGTKIEPGDYLLLAADRDHLGFALSATGETVILSGSEASEGAVIDQVTFGLQLPDLALCRVGEEWALAQPSPGKENTAPHSMGDVNGLYLSEWLAVGSPSSPDEFIEVYNPSKEPVAIGGLGLTDEVANKRRYRSFPPLSFIGAESARVFYADGEAESGADHLDFKLSSEGEVFGLLDVNGTPIDFAIMGPQRLGVSQGREEDGSLVFYERPTPGSLVPSELNDNDRLVMNALRIAEIHYHPEGNGDDEFIELVNIGSKAIDLNGIQFAAGIEFTFPQHTLNPDERIVLVKDRRAFQRTYGREIAIAGEFDGKLSNGGETLTVTTAAGETVIELQYNDKWHRLTDGRGYSLVLKNLQESRLNAKKAWRPSYQAGGSPGKPESRGAASPL